MRRVAPFQKSEKTTPPCRVSTGLALIGSVTVIAELEPAAIGAIAGGVLIIVGFIYWRIRLSRKPKGAKDENPD